MPEVVVGHPFGLNVDSRLQTAGMTEFGSSFRVNDIENKYSIFRLTSWLYRYPGP